MSNKKQSDRLIKLPSALDIYEKIETGKYDHTTDYRDDMFLNIMNGSAILVEEGGLHSTDPFQLNVSDIANWSTEQKDDINLILTEYYANVYDSNISELKLNAKPKYELFPEYDGFDEEVVNKEFEKLDWSDKSKLIIDKCNNRIDHLLKDGETFDDSMELDLRRKNIFNINFINDNYNITDLINRLSVDNFTSLNSVTVLQSAIENGSDKTPYKNSIRQYKLGEVLKMMSDSKYDLPKNVNRPLVLPNTTGDRIIGDENYINWSGLQIFDVDLKFSKLFKDNPEMTAHDIRDIVFNKLKHYPWLLAVGISTSKRSLHVWTKVSKMHDLYHKDNTEANINISKYWYRMSYIQKFAAISYVLKEFCDIDDVYTNDKIMDSHAAKPAQGIFVNYDPGVKYNNNFIDIYPVIQYEKPPTKNIKINEWLDIPEVLNNFTSWFSEFAIFEKISKGVDVTSVSDIKISFNGEYKLNDIKQFNMLTIPKGEKYRLRYRTVNAVIGVMGDSYESRELLYHILQAEGKQGQIDAFVRSAVINKKVGDANMIKKLQKIGLNFKIDDSSVKDIKEVEMSKAESMLKNSNYIFNSVQPNNFINLGGSEYLNDKRGDIIKKLSKFKLNLIDSPPNTGKTTLFKELAKTYKVCMVLPFTSTIESKIITDEEISSSFDVYMGDESTKKIPGKQTRSVVMTFDKFSNLSPEAYKQFDFIVIDESHLLYTSSYRLKVTGLCVNNIREFIKNESSVYEKTFSGLNSLISSHIDSELMMNSIDNSRLPYFIMMTGTVTGESDYFSKYNMLNYIKIEKKHPFEKNMNIVLCESSETKNILIYEKIAESIKAGKKVLYPTNNGDMYISKVVSGVEDFIGRPIKYEYYKRANNDEGFVTKINVDGVTDDIELICSTDYLSVGIDINESNDYVVIFNNDFTAEEIEQFNNRLRKTNINSFLFCDVLTDDGMLNPSTISLNTISYDLTDDLASTMHDERCISKIQRRIKTKGGYHAVLSEMTSDYFRVSENGKIEFIIAALEVDQYEIQYRKIANGLLYIKTSLEMKYGYTISVSTEPEYNKKTLDRFSKLTKDAGNEHRNSTSERTIELLNFLVEDVNYIGIKDNKHTDLKLVKTQDEFDINETNLSMSSHTIGIITYTLTYNKVYKNLLEKNIKRARRLRKFYNEEKSKEIINNSIRKSGVLNYSELDRDIRLFKLIENDNEKNIGEDTKGLLEIAYKFVDPSKQKIKMDRCEYDLMVIKLREHINKEIIKITDNELKSIKRLKEVNTKIDEFITILFKKNLRKESVSIEFRKAYKFNSNEYVGKWRRDEIFNGLMLDRDTEQENIENSLRGHNTFDSNISNEERMKEYEASVKNNGNSDGMMELSIKHAADTIKRLFS